MQTDDNATLRARMTETGIGYAGIEGAWWLPACAPFVLPLDQHERLYQAARAMFGLLDVVGERYGTVEGEQMGLNALLNYKVPSHLIGVHSRQPVLSLRPDFQLSAVGVAATELEICPSAQGYVHAMQLAYGLRPDLVPALADLVKKCGAQAFVFVCTVEWSEFWWEQLAICRALADYGVRGYVYLSTPIHTLAEQVQRGELWQPPIFGVPHKPALWQDDVLARIDAGGFAPYVLHDLAAVSPSSAIYFRFGYFDCFSPLLMQQLAKLEQQGAIFLNPTSFVYENKAVMAALHLNALQKDLLQRDADAPQVLATCIPETYVLARAADARKFADATISPERLCHERADWVLKFAGFDKGNQAWGGRSLQIGAQHNEATWREVVARYVDLPFPVVAQRVSPSQQVDIDFYAGDDRKTLRNGTTRLRSFMFRDVTSGGITIAGSHLTISGGTMQVSEGSGAVQTPIVFADNPLP